MAQFKEMGFSFNGLNSTDLGYYIVTTNGSDESQLGLNKSIVEEDTNNFAKAFRGVTYNAFSFEIQITKMDNQRNFLDITEQDVEFLNGWLMKPNDYKIFISNDNRDILYYALFTEMKGVRYGEKGYVTLQMKLNSGCAYSTVAHHQYTVTDTLTFEIYTQSTVEEYTLPDINFIAKGIGNNTIQIFNDTLGEEMTFTDIPQNYEVIAYNEGMKQVRCVNDKSFNVNHKFNKNWLRLAYGRNIIRIVGNCEIDIFFQQKIAIQN